MEHITTLEIITDNSDTSALHAPSYLCRLDIDDACCLLLKQIIDEVVLESMSLSVHISGIPTTWQSQE